MANNKTPTQTPAEDNVEPVTAADTPLADPTGQASHPAEARPELAADAAVPGETLPWLQRVEESEHRPRKGRAGLAAAVAVLVLAAGGLGYVLIDGGKGRPTPERSDGADATNAALADALLKSQAVPAQAAPAPGPSRPEQQHTRLATTSREDRASPGSEPSVSSSRRAPSAPASHTPAAPLATGSTTTSGTINQDRHAPGATARHHHAQGHQLPSHAAPPHRHAIPAAVAPPRPAEHVSSRRQASFAAGRPVVQLGAFPNERSAERAWEAMSKRSPVRGATHRIERASVGGRIVYRVRVQIRAGGCERVRAVSGRCFLVSR